MRAAGLVASIVLLGGAWLALDLARSPVTMLRYMDPDPVIGRPDHVYEPRSWPGASTPRRHWRRPAP